ncbi:hypothetical protein [Curvivirga aplysinae]|uniref:hypothetical protein n=1 Tax=Curvivirga aplysinae TaxID=2529852 RepID=UPI0012BCB789|nr:hypothetical protein [Curvivirga aplysinae]MTI08986.1 hypothetical protein [Curvivirga aplysinae]
MTKYLAILSAFLFFAQSQAFATVTNVSASPSVANVSVKGSSKITVTWTVTRFFDVAGGNVATENITSSNANLVINGTTVGTLGGTLSQSTTLAGNETRNFTIRETLTVSPTLAAQIVNAATGTVSISRNFTDNRGGTSGSFNVAVGNAPAGELSLRRIELKFSNNSHTAVIRKDDQLRAVAKVNFRSSGLFRGEWRLVDPSGSLGGGNGRLLKTIRQQFVSTGDGSTQIVSPPLPSDVNGLHRVILVIDDTDDSVSAPELRYFVLESVNNKASAKVEMISPADQARISQDTVFSWKPIRGAEAYQLEILSVENNQRVSGKLVPGKDIRMNLSSLSLDHLESGKRYHWYIRAFGKEGNVIGLSEKQTLFMP